MQITFNPKSYNLVFMGQQKKFQQRESIKDLLTPLETDPEASIKPLRLMRGINPNSSDVFDTFAKIDRVTRTINFTKDHDAWVTCLGEELEEFNDARNKYLEDKTTAKKEHMIEEMGDLFYTLSSMATESGINPQEAFKMTNRKFYNRISLMERFCLTDKNKPDSLAECTDVQRRGLWNGAKRTLYDITAVRYAKEELKLDTNA